MKTLFENSKRRYRWMIASLMVARKLIASLWNRVSTRRHFLSHPMHCSITPRQRYATLPNLIGRTAMPVPLVVVLGNDRNDPMGLEPLANPWVAVSLVAGRSPGPPTRSAPALQDRHHAVHDRLE